MSISLFCLQQSILKILQFFLNDSSSSLMTSIKLKRACLQGLLSLKKSIIPYQFLVSTLSLLALVRSHPFVLAVGQLLLQLLLWV